MYFLAVAFPNSLWLCHLPSFPPWSTMLGHYVFLCQVVLAKAQSSLRPTLARELMTQPISEPSVCYLLLLCNTLFVSNWLQEWLQWMPWESWEALTFLKTDRPCTHTHKKSLDLKSGRTICEPIEVEARWFSSNFQLHVKGVKIQQFFNIYCILKPVPWILWMKSSLNYWAATDQPLDQHTLVLSLIFSGEIDRMDVYHGISMHHSLHGFLRLQWDPTLGNGPDQWNVWDPVPLLLLSTYNLCPWRKKNIILKKN